MFNTKKHLTRRHVLKGLGVSLGLPLLDAMVPASTLLAQTAAKTTPGTRPRPMPGAWWKTSKLQGMVVRR